MRRRCRQAFVGKRTTDSGTDSDEDGMLWIRIVEVNQTVTAQRVPALFCIRTHLHIALTFRILLDHKRPATERPAYLKCSWWHDCIDSYCVHISSRLFPYKPQYQLLEVLQRALAAEHELPLVEVAGAEPTLH